VLLHGVTGSGKTEIYIRLIEEQIEQGKQVLYLLPEIALTTQIINRLRKYFGDKVGVYHSRFNEQERAEIWAKTIKGEYSVLLGARSSLFLPFVKLGLVIVDEEHENTFKQFDPAPRYHARDSAIVMASMFRAKVLLGSATPSIDSYFNANSGKYGLTELLKRFGGIQLPEVQCIDLKTSAKRKEMKESFSDTLLEHIRTTLENGEQIILFQNRRGYTPQWICESCNWVPKCKHCDVSLTYHKAVHQLQCHYCSTVYPPPKSCPACGSHHLKMAGFGTEKIEEDLTTLIPGIKVARMDLDSTRSKNAYIQILSDFEDRKIDVLVGTQMVTKGLDFDDVGLVGILNADNMLNFPDFRAFERSFQLIAQVSGRAGRKNKRGMVQIQTWNPNHWVIQKVMQNDYLGLYHQEIIERKNFQYPPFVKLIKLTVRNKDQNLIESATKALGERIRPLLQKRLLGPEKPAIPRIRNYYYRTFLIKIEKGSSYPQLKKELYESIREFRASKEGKNTFVDIDIDPQ
jgi:primosomal protein N' (replication factor Y)